MISSYGLVLRKAGYHVIEANSGSVALKMAQQHLPDLILSDIHMPGGDGSTLLHDLRNDPELKSKQIVLMTGKPEQSTPRRIMEEGADDFLAKPATMEALLGCVKARFSRASISWRVEDGTLANLRSAVPANLPHEFFTPMAGIIGLMEILRSSYADLTPAEIEDIHTDVYRSALRLNRTLRNYLLILEIQTASAKPLSKPLSPGQLEESINSGVEEALRLNERRDDVTIRVKPCAIAVKPADLSRMVEELVDNAFKFSRLGTPVVVELGEGRLLVTDEGRGLTSEEIGSIGAFQQFDRKKYEQQGLGLGLILVRKICESSGATFSLESQSGKGTRAQIAFPPATTVNCLKR